VAGGGGGATKNSAVGGDVDLFARTWESLDFGVVLERLSGECRTEMGRVRALVPDFKTTLEDVRAVARGGQSCRAGEIFFRGVESRYIPARMPWQMRCLAALYSRAGLYSGALAHRRDVHFSWDVWRC